MPITCRNILPRWQGAITLPQGGGNGLSQRQWSASKAMVYLKGSGLSQKQRPASKAMVCFKGNGEWHFKRLLRQIAAEVHHLNICATAKLLSATHAFLPTGNGKGALIPPFVRAMRHGAIHVSFIRIGFQINAVGVSPSYSGKVFYLMRAFQQFVSS